MAFGSRSFVVRGWFPRQHVGAKTSSKLNNKKRKLHHDTGKKTLAASTRLHVKDPACLGAETDVCAHATTKQDVVGKQD
jgi:hypothetical protein